MLMVEVCTALSVRGGLGIEECSDWEIVTLHPVTHSNIAGKDRNGPRGLSAFADFIPSNPPP